MFNKKYRYSKYLSGFETKRMFETVYKNKLLGTLKLSIQYHFERDLFDNETMYIYTDRPGILIGKGGIYYDALEKLYKQINPKCKGIKIFETGYIVVN